MVGIFPLEQEILVMGLTQGTVIVVSGLEVSARHAPDQAVQ